MDQNRPEAFSMDLKSISLAQSQGDDGEIVELTEDEGFILNTLRFNDFRVRKAIFEKLKQAQQRLPDNLKFVIYEAYRPKSFQEELWARTNKKMREQYPNASDEEIMALAETFTANPYDGIGSGHMAACAVDITLCDLNGNELDMGIPIFEKNHLTATIAEGVSENAKTNRALLKNTLEDTGLVNYPAEWWHYSYGDHQWAWLTGRKEALYGPIDL